MKLKAILGLAAGLLTFASSSQAALMNFTGEIEYHNDVVYTYFTVEEDATDVRVWTDSWNWGTNFDPITSLWNAGGDWIMSNDDNASINPGTQTYADSGFSLANLAAGDYIFTIATYANRSISSNLADGFDYDQSESISMEDWDQPANTINMGGFWSVWLDGVSSASSGQPQTQPSQSVPESSSFILLLVGMLGLGLARRKKA